MQENEVKAPVPEPEAPDSQTESKANMPAGSGGNGRPKIPSEPASKGVAEGRHARKCNICNHSDRAAIEFDFINWRNPAELVKSFQLRDLSTIYRHAHATGLFARRRLNLRGLMERIAERVSEVPITAAAIIRAARAIAHINDAGEWIDPPTRIIVEHRYLSKPACRGGGRNGTVKIKKVSHAMFTPANLDEPSPEAVSCGERPRIDPKSKSPYPTEIVLEIDPVLYEAGQARKRRAEAACLAQDAKEVADSACPEERREQSRGAAFPEPSPNLRSGPKVTVAPWKTVPPGVYDPFSRATRIGQPVVDAKCVSGQAPCPVVDPVEDPELARLGERSRREPSRTGQPVEGAEVVSGQAPCPEGTRTGQPVEGTEVVSGTGSQPVDAKGQSMATQPASRPSGLVARAGSAGSTDPPFPFDPSPKLWRKGRKRWH